MTTTTTSSTTTTSVVSEAVWTVAGYGRTPTTSLNDTDALGAGCAPGTDHLPDGIWFGWIEDSGSDHIEFDLACLWPGRLLPAASNDSGKLRHLATSADTLVWSVDADPISFTDWDGEPAVSANAPGLPESRPFWIFVNNAIVTEMSEYPETIDWMLQESAWSGMGPGAGDDGDVAPPSPTGPWPAEGWPADGFYAPLVTWSDTQLDITLSKWVRCSDHPGMCPESWTGDEVTIDVDALTLQCTIPFDRDLTVVIMPVHPHTPIVGDGLAFRALLDDLESSNETWRSVSPDEIAELSKDPRFPFGEPYGLEPSPDLGYLLYRGPGGAFLTPFDREYLGEWEAIEIRSGHPILYIYAHIIAG